MNSAETRVADQSNPSLTKRIMWSVDRFFARHSKVGDRTFFDNATFPFVPALEAEWGKIRAELDTLLPHVHHMPNFQDLSKDQAKLTQGEDWKTFFFYAYGLKAIGNCRRCPQTTRLLRTIPGMKTAFFSILAPGARLPVHRGPYKGVLRLHLALLIPEPENCGIRVGSELRRWEEGKVLIFDDTFPHEAWNDTGRHRVVLFVDMMRPSRFPANLVNALMTWAIAFSPFVLGSAGTYLRWERRFDRLANKA